MKIAASGSVLTATTVSASEKPVTWFWRPEIRRRDVRRLYLTPDCPITSLNGSTPQSNTGLVRAKLAAEGARRGGGSAAARHALDRVSDAHDNVGVGNVQALVHVVGAEIEYLGADIFNRKVDVLFPITSYSCAPQGCA